MDPELQLQAAEMWEKFVASGVDRAEATRRVESWMAAPVSGDGGDRPSVVGGTAMSALQGASLGTSDEVYGAARAVGALVPGGQSPAEAYSEHTTGAREYLSEFGEDHPFLRAGGDLAGGLGAALATGGIGLGVRGAATGARGVSAAGRLARVGAVEGAVIGGVEGAARAEGGPGSRLVAGAGGAAAGGAFGAAAGALTPVFSRAGATATGAVVGGAGTYLAGGGDKSDALIGAGAGAGVGRIGGRLGARLARIVGEAGPATAGERASVAAGRALGREGVSPEQLTRVAAEAPDVNLLGLTGRTGAESSVQRLARGAQSIPSRGSSEMSSFLRRESDEAPGRIREALQRDTGLKFENVHETLDAAAARQRATARPLYEEAYQHSVPVSDNIADALSNDQFRSAYERGRRIARLEGVDVPALPDFGELTEAGADLSKITDMPDIPVQAVDYMKRGLDDLIESGFRSGSIARAEARALRGRLRSVLSEVDDAVPSFGQARAAWAGEQASRDAMEAAVKGNRELGLKKFVNEAPEAIERAMTAMSPSEREFYRRGALDSIRELLGKRQDTRADLSRLLIGRGGGDVVESDLRKRLRLLFDTDADMQNFVRSMLEERGRASAGGFILGGSPTQRIAAEQADLAGTVATPDLDIKRMGAELLRRRVGEHMMGLTESAVDELAPRLTGPLSDIAPQILRDLEQYQRRLATRSALAGRAGAAQAGALVGSSVAVDDRARRQR
jgi:hypothetical protein